MAILEHGLKISRPVLLATTVALLIGGAVMVIAMTTGITQQDPYVRSVLTLTENSARGQIIFENNCSACHGLLGKGKVGPNLEGVARRRTDEQIIHQVVSGKTPPMPRFELSSQQMADLLGHLKKL